MLNRPKDQGRAGLRMLDIEKTNFQGEASVAALLTSGSPGPPAPGCQQHQQQCVDANINIYINTARCYPNYPMYLY